MAVTLGANTIRVLRGTYTGFVQNYQPSVVPLLGRDPAQTINEAIQSSALPAKEAALTCWCDTTAERNALVTLLGAQSTFDDGQGEGSHNVNVMAVKAKRDPESATPKWVVEITLRER